MESNVIAIVINFSGETTTLYAAKSVEDAQQRFATMQQYNEFDQRDHEFVIYENEIEIDRLTINEAVSF